MSALVPCTPLGVAITSTCKPYFLKIPASCAAHGGTMEPESDVMAARILRGLEISPALTERQWLKQPRTHKTRSDRLINIADLRKICPNVLQQIADRIAR